ncbi:MAG: aminoglycoside phosphotransferase family protein [Planctomycetota bacterium]
MTTASPALPAGAAHFARMHGFDPATCKQVPGGRNNRVYRVEATDGAPAALKLYFQHPEDHRDRWHSEATFLDYATGRGIAAVPRVIARERTVAATLLEWIDGDAMTTAMLRPSHVEAAVALLADLNPASGPNQHQNQHQDDVVLPSAAEACFSRATHCAMVTNRVAALVETARSDAIAPDLSDFIGRELAPATQTLVDRIAALPGAHTEPLPAAGRCVSPSDLGFHNALIDRAGRVRFVDFEYAGWDDPAKLICDFWLQPQCPIDPTWRAPFATQVAEWLGDAGHGAPDALLQRVAQLAPLYALKWCCIVLNPLLAVARERRRFAGNDEAEQLATARRLLGEAEQLASTDPLL